MYSLTRPDDERVRAFIEAQSALEHSYDAVGATRGAAPAGHAIGRARAALGRGADMFERARQAIRDWKMFPPPVEVFWPTAPIEVGTTVAVLARPAGIWSLNACRIVYTVDDEEDGCVVRYGFAYGTLPDHAVRGEERFLVEWNREDDLVSYDLFAFSQQNQLLAKVGTPISKRLQARFRAASAAAMQAAVGYEPPDPDSDDEAPSP